MLRVNELTVLDLLDSILLRNMNSSCENSSDLYVTNLVNGLYLEELKLHLLDYYKQLIHLIGLIHFHDSTKLPYYSNA